MRIYLVCNLSMIKSFRYGLLVLACFAQPSLMAMVRYGNFLNMGDAIFRYVPSSFQSSALQEVSSGAMSLDVHGFTTYTGMESLTLMSNFKALWLSDSHFDQVDEVLLRNELAWSLSPRVSVGAGVDVVWADQSALGNTQDHHGVQYDLLLRWRW
jgi:hypothetical protein